METAKIATIICCSISGIANIAIIVLNAIWYFSDKKRWEEDRQLEEKERQKYLEYIHSLPENEL